MTTRNRNRTPRRGVTLVEFAFAFPILLTIVFGMVEFVRMHNIRHAADNASYEAARHVIVPGASKAEAVDKANDLLARAGVSKGTFTVTPDVITDDTEQVTVRVSVSLEENSWLPSQLTAKRTIVRETTLMTERGR